MRTSVFLPLTLLLALPSSFAVPVVNVERGNHPHPHPQPPSPTPSVVTVVEVTTGTTTTVTSTESVSFVTSSTTTAAPSKRTFAAREAEAHPHPHPQPDPTTVTVTSTATATSTTVVTPTCTDPVGWNWAHYFSPYLDSNGDTQTADLGYFKDKQPDDQGVVDKPGIRVTGQQSSTPGTFYSGSNAVNTSQFFLDHHAYLKVPTTGRYNISLNYVDNVVDLWLGDTATSGWTRNNADLEQSYSNSGAGGSKTFSLNAGDYVPIRISLLNTGGPGVLDISITGPDGSDVPANDFVQYGCLPSDNAPLFPAWGNES